MSAHRALEEAVLTDKQNFVKSQVGQEWVNLVYRGFYFEPLRENLEAFLLDSQKTVSGEVTLKQYSQEPRGSICSVCNLVRG